MNLASPAATPPEGTDLGQFRIKTRSRRLKALRDPQAPEELLKALREENLRLKSERWDLLEQNLRLGAENRALQSQLAAAQAHSSDLLRNLDNEREGRDQDRNFLRRLVHDFKNALTGILVYSGFLKREESLGEKGRSRVAGVMQSVTLLVEHLSYMVDYLARGEKEPDWKSHKLQELLEGIIKEFKFSTEEQNIKISMTSYDNPIYILTDETRFKRAFRNLIQNAIDSVVDIISSDQKQSRVTKGFKTLLGKFGLAQKRQPSALEHGVKINISRSEDRKYAVIVVSNPGEISEANAERLFDFHKSAISTKIGGESIGQQNILFSIAAIKGGVRLIDRGSLKENRPVKIQVLLPLVADTSKTEKHYRDELKGLSAF